MNRHLLSIDDLSRDDIERILGRAESFAEVSGREIKKVPTLRGRTVINLFYEASTRTSSSFELAAKRLSADLVSIKSSGSAVDKGESLKDTVQTLSAYDPAAIVIRSPHAGAAALVARWTRASVVNAGDGKHEHPTQALLDLYTLKQRLGALEGLKVWIVGDVLHSRVARSNILAFGADGLRGDGLRAADADPARDRVARLPRALHARRARGRRRGLRPAHAARAHERLVRALAARVRRALPDRRPPPEPQPAADAPRPGQPRRGAGRRGDRLAAGPDRRSRSSRAWWCGWPCSTSCSPAAAPRPGCAVGARRPSRSRHERRRAHTAAGRWSSTSRPPRRAVVLLRGARLLDPRAGPRRRARRAGARRPRGRAGRPASRRPTAPRWSTPRACTRSPPSSTRTCTCARPGARTRRTSTPARAPPRRAASAPSSPAQHRPGGGLGARAALAARARPRRGPDPHRLPGRDHRGPAGEQLTEMAELADAGAAGFTDDGLPVRSAGVMRQALQYQRLAGRMLALHEEDPSLSGDGRDARGRGVRAARPGRHPVGLRVHAWWRATARWPPTRRGASTCSTCRRARPWR